MTLAKNFPRNLYLFFLAFVCGKVLCESSTTGFLIDINSPRVGFNCRQLFSPCHAWWVFGAGKKHPHHPHYGEKEVHVDELQKKTLSM